MLASLALVFAGCLSTQTDVASDEAPDAVKKLQKIPHVVVAVIDTGINPYHSEFAEASTEPVLQHPDVLLDGYPTPEVKPLALSLDSATYKDATQADKELWDAVETRQLVSFPGTKVVGGISFSKTGNLLGLPGGEPETPYVLDRAGHGTMTGSRIAGNTISLGGTEVRLVAVQAQLSLDELESAADALNWVAAQDWIDIVSNSWGMPVPLGPAGSSYTKWTEAIKNVAEKKPTFFAAGNGLGNGIGSGYPSELQDTCTAEVICVGGHDNGKFVYWPNWMPQISGDVESNPAAEHEDTQKITNSGGGTSSATPFSAGGGAALLLEARKLLGDTGGVRPGGVLAEAGPDAQLPATGPLSDGRFTLDEFKRVLYHTAVVPQEDASDGEAGPTSIPIPVQDQLPFTLYPFFGYGEVNAKSVDAAKKVARGEQDEPVRMAEDALYEHDRQLREALYG